MMNEEQSATGANPEPQPGSADDLRDALSNLSHALDRFGRAAEARVRHEWSENRPDADKKVDEVKRGVESLVKKSADALDTLSRRLIKDEPEATPTTPPSGEDTPTGASATGASATGA